MCKHTWKIKMGIKCSKCGIPQSDSSILLYDEYSCRCHVCTDNDKICKDCNRNLLIYGGNCRHRFKYSIRGILCCYT